MAKRKILPRAAVERLLKKAGAERVSPAAVEALAEILEDFAEEVARDAVKYARYAKRKTIKREDVEMAASA